MNNLYKITKGQLVTLWVFGLIGLIVSLSFTEDSGFAIFCSILIPMALVFYTIGWKNKTKKNFQEVEKIQKHIFSKKKVKKLIIFPILFLIIVGVLVAGGIYISNTQEAKAERDSYIGSFKKYEKNLENAKTCITQKIDLLKEEHINQCRSLYNKTKTSYQDCRDTLYWKDHTFCINQDGNNYEQIDCSSENITKKITEEKKAVCYSEVIKESSLITTYEENITTEFLKSQSKVKASFTIEELEELYKLFPQEAFNDLTKERVNKFLESEGYSIVTN